MKKRFKLWVAYMLILCMSMAVMLPNSKTVKADDMGELEIFDFNVFKGDTPLDKDVELWDDERLNVSFKWSLPDSDHEHKVFSTVIENYELIKFIDRQEIELRLDTEVVGKLTLEVDESTGNVIVSAVFKDDYLEKSDRNGGVIVEAYADIHKGAADDGKEKSISIRMWYHFPFTYRASGDGSSLWVWKSAHEKMYKGADGKYKQDFYVSLRTNGGEVTDVKLSDYYGNGLSNPGLITIDKSNVSGIDEGSEMSLKDLETKLAKMPKDAQVGFTYTVDVDGNVYSESASQNGDYRNTFRADYKDNTSEQKHAEASADVSVSRPYVRKSGEILRDADGNPTGKIEWTINIDLNDLAGTELTLDDITDNMLAGASNMNPTYRWDGKISGYTVTYESDIPAGDMNSLSDHTYCNDVTVSVDGHNYNGSGEVTLPAQSWIEKSFDKEHYDGQNNILPWKIVLHVPSETITDVSLDDWGEQNGAWHELVRDSVRIQVDNGKIIPVPEYDWSNTQQVWLNLYANKIEFVDDYIESIKGSTLTVYADTLIKDDTVDGKIYINKAYLNYKLNGNPIRLEASAEWQKNSAILKTGAADSSATAIDYSVDIDLSKLESKLELKSGTPIIIRDIIPEGLIFDEASCKVIGKRVYGQWNKYPDDELNAASTVTFSANGREFEFEIPVTDAMLQRIQAIRAEGQDVILSLMYTAGISDVRKYLTDGTELTFTNTARGEYGGTDIGDSTNITKLTPKQLIKKDWWYNTNSAPYISYEIRVNPDRLDLSDGSLTVTDSMGEKLVYCLDTIKVEKYEGWDLVPLVNGKDYSYVYSQEDNSVVFTLPDSESLLISYKAYVNAYVDDKIINNEDLTEENAYNNVSISGYSSEPGADRVYFSGKAKTPRGWASNSGNTVNLLKIYESDNGTVFLEGCEFRLSEYSIRDGVITEGSTVKNVVTDENGSVLLDGMVSGQLYGLVETGVPDGGFTVKKEPLYFIFGSNEQNPMPSEYGVTYVNNGAKIIFENDPPKGEEESSDEPSEPESSTEEPESSEPETSSEADEPSEPETSSEADEPSEPESSSEATEPSETEPSSEAAKPSEAETETETQTRNGDVEGEGSTTSGTPSKPEKETGSPSTETKTEAEGEADPDNDRNGDVEGEGNLVNTSDSPYIKVVLVLLILGVIAAVITEITVLCSRSDERC